MKKLEVVAGIITNNNEILCMERGKGKYDYVSFKYEFPGGKIEQGETPAEALHRELTEELDMEVDIKVMKFFQTVNHVYPDFEITMHSFLCPVNNRKFVMKEHVNYKWLTKEKLMDLDWAEADKPIVAHLIED